MLVLIIWLFSLLNSIGIVGVLGVRLVVMYGYCYVGVVLNILVIVGLLLSDMF